MTTAALTQESSQTSLVTTFYIADALCGVNTSSVQEVIQVDGVTTVHHAPGYIKGIINLRGKIVTIINLSRKLDLPQSALTDESRVFIVEWKDEYIGLLVDVVSDVVGVDLGNLDPPPANVGGVQGRYFKGVCQPEQKLVAILDLDEVLSMDGD